MPYLKFDPFGETIAQDLRSTGYGRQSTASRLVLRLGVGLFWTFVAAIVAARVAFFDPDTLEKLGAVARLIRNAIAYV